MLRGLGSRDSVSQLLFERLVVDDEHLSRQDAARKLRKKERKLVLNWFIWRMASLYEVCIQIRPPAIQYRFRESNVPEVPIYFLCFLGSAYDMFISTFPDLSQYGVCCLPPLHSSLRSSLRYVTQQTPYWDRSGNVADEHIICYFPENTENRELARNYY